MLNLGVIGTNWITKMFVEAAEQSEAYTLTSVYSRKVETGQAFAPTAKIYTNLSEFFDSGIDVVYIASPNSLHFAQAAQAIQHDLQVIVEKSIFSNPTEYEEIYSLLRDHPKAHLFEATRHVHQPNFKAIEAQVAEMPVVSGGTFVYEKYSSRFDAYLAGEEPNVLTREFSAGALTDLGVYPIYAIVKLFGMPKSSHYFATKLANGADGRGTAILRYDGFDMTAQFGKMATSYQHSELLGQKDTIVIDNIAELNEVQYVDGQGNQTTLSHPLTENPMLAEANDFARIINAPAEYADEYREWLLLSQRVNQVLTDLRKSAGIVFPADH
ncbi:putative dehydrogenase [Weissella uvarum]|uniref:Gfo/Idh/MocA family protein n=1 Tax=Weissella uvarum TaxID=1479233 RepID=UPI00195F3F77|nr:Gfo/Idh/MocA family oxidoreductase [Weissella uvarum]MBM7617199.1 putative dehydrogenase [Weissella uvarum]MCM0595492.1 Gfo/Idh/MocA family oxidoreductase [Weissella uvarum]